MSMIVDMVARGWDNFIARPTGSLNLRFVIQPTIAPILAVRAGLRDARASRPAYLWAAITNPDYRWQLLHSGWKEMATPFLVAATLDAVYQLITQRCWRSCRISFCAAR